MWLADCDSSGALAPGREDQGEPLHARETTFALVSLAPFEKLAAYKARKGWTVPWYSSYGGDFNYDFHVTVDESVAPLLINALRSRQQRTTPPARRPDNASTADRDL